MLIWAQSTCGCSGAPAAAARREDGRREPDWLGQVLAARVRDPAVKVAAPHGLCLEEVRYPPQAGLAARAAAIRRVRLSP